MTDHSAHTNQTALVRNKLHSRKPAGALQWTRMLVLGFACALALVVQARAQELSNSTLQLRLNVTAQGIPVINEAVWQATGQTVFRDLGTPDGLSAWVPPSLIPATPPAPPAWEITDGEDFITAEATSELVNKMLITWIVELPKHGQLFRLRIRLTNAGKKPRAIDWFPAWSANWDVGGQSQWARWWRSIEYNRIEQALNINSQIKLGSQLHSSDDAGGGVNPYWVVVGQDSRIYFGLQWCGGWSAKLSGLNQGFAFAVNLPPSETQLVLKKGQMIEGPVLLVTPVAGGSDTDGRAVWMRQRYGLGQLLYDGPKPAYPLSYNHWYAIRGKVNDVFLNRQIDAMSPYGFDTFVVDAGWFAEGRWKPDKTKFLGNDLIDILAALKASDIQVGLWSTPQYVNTDSSASALGIEEPPVASRFFDGYLVDMSDADFTEYLTSHVKMLREKYSMDYWKYDQPFFTDQSQAGEMKNVVGFQNAMQAVRAANPDLTIENCLDGGRMINDFTLLATQTSWLKDAGPIRQPDPQGNISTALNALEFVFPWAALRFTLNLDQIDPNDDEMTRLYCRSAMIGRWGISTDLSLIGERQQNVILKEIQNYRQLNHTKFSCLYDLLLPDDAADVAGVTFYNGRRLSASVLLYRWQRDGAFDHRVLLPKLKPWMTYRVTDTDTGTQIVASGSDLISAGITVPFSNERRSALLFVESITEAPAP